MIVETINTNILFNFYMYVFSTFFSFVKKSNVLDKRLHMS